LNLEDNTKNKQTLIRVCIGIAIITFANCIVFLGIYYREKWFVVSFFSGEFVIISLSVRWLIVLMEGISQDNSLAIAAAMVESECDYREFLTLVKVQIKNKTKLDISHFAVRQTTNLSDD
jgi:hypothetical protein